MLILEEVERSEVDWESCLTLFDAGMSIRSEMKMRYPELNDLALDAIVWKCTFDWR